jgi:transcription-repair coupling factor (superfamily II helicase)
VFFVHHRVSDIHEIAGMIEEVAGVTTAVAHGQMEGSQLEKVMVQFIEGDFDVLVATSIIESGLDIPNANTIIINNAHMFGLSDLHQMRGRVGRSNTKAYCYLMSPPLSGLTDHAKRRLKTLEEYADLGSGLQVAMKDLDIRGAGNLLGGEQSGFISEIGFEMYHKILDETIRELREEEFKGVLEEKKSIESRDAVIDTDYDMIIPDFYVRNVPERLGLYTQLSSIDTETGLLKFKEDLIDRFGKLPDIFASLLETVRLKWIAKRLGIEKVLIRRDKMKLYFPADQNAYVYKSDEFGNVINYVMMNPKTFTVKQTANELLIVAIGVNDIYEALGLLGEMERFVQSTSH